MSPPIEGVPSLPPKRVAPKDKRVSQGQPCQECGTRTEWYLAKLFCPECDKDD